MDAFKAYGELEKYCKVLAWKSGEIAKRFGRFWDAFRSCDYVGCGDWLHEVEDMEKEIIVWREWVDQNPLPPHLDPHEAPGKHCFLTDLHEDSPDLTGLVLSREIDGKVAGLPSSQECNPKLDIVGDAICNLWDSLMRCVYYLEWKLENFCGVDVDQREMAKIIGKWAIERLAKVQQDFALFGLACGYYARDKKEMGVDEVMAILFKIQGGIEAVKNEASEAFKRGENTVAHALSSHAEINKEWGEFGARHPAQMAIFKAIIDNPTAKTQSELAKKLGIRQSTFSLRLKRAIATWKKEFPGGHLPPIILNWSNPRKGKTGDSGNAKHSRKSVRFIDGKDIPADKQPNFYDEIDASLEESEKRKP